MFHGFCSCGYELGKVIGQAHCQKHHCTYPVVNDGRGCFLCHMEKHPLKLPKEEPITKEEWKEMTETRYK